MFYTVSLRNGIACAIILCVSLTVLAVSRKEKVVYVQSSDDTAVKWMEFNVTSDALSDAISTDIMTSGNDYPVCVTDIVAYLACIYGNDFSKYSRDDIDGFVQKIRQGNTVEEICREYKYFDYYRASYGAVVGNFVGDYELDLVNETGGMVTVKKYGIKVYSPIAAGYSYNHYDDFGAPRSYGYKRTHLGNDLMGSIGTPIVCIESGTVEEVGWNRYGGWRIGIRSYDKHRYYYYAHLRKDHPYSSDFRRGDEVGAGEVIGYLGMTGYSEKENVNNINVPHLHLGIQIIFDENAENEIWIDVYDIVDALGVNRSETVYDEQSGEYKKKYPFRDFGGCVDETAFLGKGGYSADHSGADLVSVSYGYRCERVCT